MWIEQRVACMESESLQDDCERDANRSGFITFHKTFGCPGVQVLDAGPSRHRDDTGVSSNVTLLLSFFNIDSLLLINLLSRSPGMLSALSIDELLAVLQGSIEDWFIENRASEAHIFHIHQVRFALSFVCVLYLWWRESGHAMACPAEDD